MTAALLRWCGIPSDRCMIGRGVGVHGAGEQILARTRTFGITVTAVAAIRCAFTLPATYRRSSGGSIEGRSARLRGGEGTRADLHRKGPAKREVP